MRFWDIVLTAAAQSGGGAAGPPPELFPDPTLEDVADGDEWNYADGFPTFGPIGGTGPGIQLSGAGDGSGGGLAANGALEAAMTAALTTGNSYSVGLTIANFSTVPDFFLVFLRGGAGTPITISGNGLASVSVQAGSDGIGSGASFYLLSSGDGAATFDITNISVTAV